MIETFPTLNDANRYYRQIETFPYTEEADVALARKRADDWDLFQIEIGDLVAIGRYKGEA